VFTGTITLPFTFTWQATGQPLVTHIVSDVSASDRITFTWRTTGIKQINVTVRHAGGIAGGAHTVEIVSRRVYLPLVLKNQ
jgi:hypothetical protein